eukprot:1151319-Pelagomonas_calceolata.AAC.3
MTVSAVLATPASSREGLEFQAAHSIHAHLTAAANPPPRPPVHWLLCCIRGAAESVTRAKSEQVCLAHGRRLDDSCWKHRQKTC